MRVRSRRFVFACIALTGAILFVGSAGLDRRRDHQLYLPRALPGEPFGAKTHKLEPIGYYDGIAKRPLFYPTRRPLPPIQAAPAVAAAAVVSPPPPPPVLDPLTLLAVLITPSRREAVIRGADGQSLTLKVGDAYQLWTLVRVLQDHVVFRDGKIETDVSFPP